MSISEESALQSLEILMKGIDNLEERLIQSGFAPEEARLWLFHVREVLGDWRRINIKIVEICNVDDVSEVPSLLNDWVNHMLYAVESHSHWHLQELEKMMDKQFLENDDSFGEESTQSESD